MNDLVGTYRQQARSFRDAGNDSRALELLARARALCRGNRALEAEVLLEMAEAAEVQQLPHDAARYRQQAAALGASPAMARQHPLNLRLAVGLPLAIVLLGFGVLLIIYLGIRDTTPPPSANQISAAGLPPDGRAVPAATMAGGRSSPPSGLPAPPVVSLLPQTRPAPPTTATSLQARLKENVASLWVIALYEGRIDGRAVSFRIVVGAGTAFAVRQDGLLLTNRHVVDARDDPTLPGDLGAVGLPLVTLRNVSLVAAFGNQPADQLSASVLYRSRRFDAALLRVARRFDSPLVLSPQVPAQGEDMWTCGYPGIVDEAFTAAAMTPERLAQIRRDVERHDRLDELALRPADCFKSTLTRGIVSAEERNINSVAFLQFDATVSPGNSGGPAMNSRHEVIGIVTSGIGGKYNFALLLEQLRDELAPWIALPKP